MLTPFAPSPAPGCRCWSATRSPRFSPCTGSVSAACQWSVKTAKPGRVLGQLKATVRRGLLQPAKLWRAGGGDGAERCSSESHLAGGSGRHARAHILTMRQALVDALQQVAPGSKVDYPPKQRGDVQLHRLPAQRRSIVCATSLAST